MKHWFLPEVPDLLGLLAHQARLTTEGLEHVARWAAGDATAEADVRDLEHQADDAKRALRSALRAAFTTPLDPEDLYELSERLDAVINGAKDLVREADLLGVAPDAPMAEMAADLLAGQRHLETAIGAIGRDDDAATAASDDAVHACRGVEKAYRQAMVDLAQVTDLGEVTTRRELYRRCARLGDAVEAVAERIWYAVVKAP